MSSIFVQLSTGTRCDYHESGHAYAYEYVRPEAADFLARSRSKPTMAPNRVAANNRMNDAAKLMPVC